MRVCVCVFSSARTFLCISGRAGLVFMNYHIFFLSWKELIFHLYLKYNFQDIVFFIDTYCLLVFSYIILFFSNFKGSFSAEKSVSKLGIPLYVTSRFSVTGFLKIFYLCLVLLTI